MRKIILLALGLTGLYSCIKKDTYGYTCRCYNNNSGATDTIYTITVQTSGEASYICKNHGDTVNAYGGNVKCKID